MKKKAYTKEFKLEAVKLVLERGMKAGQVAQDLGVAHSSVGKWVREFGENGQHAFPGKGRLLPWDEERRLLEIQVRRLTIERDILKKTIGYLAEKP